MILLFADAQCIPSSNIPMKDISTINRRRFLQAGFVGSTTFAAASFLPRSSDAAVTKTKCDPFHDLKVGLTTYTLRKFNLDEAIAMTKQAGVKYISLKEVHLPLKSTTAERQAARKKVEDAGLILMGGGVIYLKNNEDEIRNAFEYAKDTGMPTIVCSPDPEALDKVEKLVKQYNIRIAIHNHGPGDEKYPSPLDVMRLVKGRDSRMGVCIDVGHTVRIGQDPAVAIAKCASRLYEFHMKDVTQADAKGGSIEVGKGVIDVVAVLKALVKIKFASHVALEYEAHGDAPMAGITESFAYMRGALAAI
jgi:sugar phosphate isomerase/epimerase